VTRGRLIVDTYLGAKELLKETEYSLSVLAEKYLGIGEYLKWEKESV
jgi:DNA polymerase elongation subunit (family B)